MAVDAVIFGSRGELCAPGSSVFVPDHVQGVEFGDPVRVQAASGAGVAHRGDERAQGVAIGVGVVGGDIEVAVGVVIGLGGGEAGAAGAGDGRVVGVEGSEVECPGDALGMDGEVEVPAVLNEIADLFR